MYILLSRTQSHISKYKLNFQNRNYKLFLFHVTFQISPLSNGNKQMEMEISLEISLEISFIFAFL